MRGHSARTYGSDYFFISERLHYLSGDFMDNFQFRRGQVKLTVAAFGTGIHIKTSGFVLHLYTFPIFPGSQADSMKGISIFLI